MTRPFDEASGPRLLEGIPAGRRPGDRPDRLPERLLGRLRTLHGAGRRIRRRLLLHGRELLGVRPTPGFPRVFGVMVDWPVELGATSVFAASTGLAMLLPSTPYAPIGDDRRLTVRVAALELVLWADEIVDLAAPADGIRDPAPGQIAFYLLTFEGLLWLSAEAASLHESSNRLIRLHRLGRAVLDEVRLSTGGGR